MSMTSDEIKEEIRRRIDIVELVSRYVPLQRMGRRFGARCPFHQEKTASFYVDPERGNWKCFGCGAFGDIFTFVMQIEGLTFPEAAERLAQRAGVEWKPLTPGGEKTGRDRQTALKANELAAEYFQQMLHSPQGKVAEDYLERRGLTPEIIKTFKIGYALNGWDGLLRYLSGKGFNEKTLEAAGLVKPRGSSAGHYDVFRHRVMFPIVDVSGRVIAFGGRALDPDEQAKYLNSPDTAVFKKGATVYGLNLARQAITSSKSALIVEGYMDVIALVQAGFENVVACLGTATTEAHLRLLSRYAEKLHFIYDADNAGKQAALRNIAVFESSDADAKIVTLPNGLDPDECVRQLGPDAVRQAVAAGISFPEYQIRMAFEQYDVHDGDGRVRAARSAVDVLVKIHDPARRQELLDRVADYWAQSNPGRGEALSRALRLEFQRRAGENQRLRRRPNAARDRAPILDAVARQAGQVPPGVLAVEAQLLFMALTGTEACRELASRVKPEFFCDECHQAIVAALFARVGEADFVPQEVVPTLPDEGGVRERAVELSVSNDDCTEEVFSDLIEKMLQYRSMRGLRREYEVVHGEIDSQPVEDDGEDFEAWRRRVAAAIDRGEIKPGDPDFLRFIQLSRRFRGAGREGFSDQAGLTALSAREGTSQPKSEPEPAAPDE